MPKKIKPTTFEAHLGAVVASLIDLTGQTREEVADKIGVSRTTFTRHLRGESGGLLVNELILFCNEYGGSPGEIIDKAVKNNGGIEHTLSSVSVGRGTTNDIDTKRKQNEARAMTTEQIEKMKHAATHDAEMDEDEPH